MQQALRSPALAARSSVRVHRRAMTAMAAPKTGFHTAPEQLMREALQHFYEDADSLVIKPTVGGVNNVVQFVEKDGKRVGLLRIYNNGNKSEKVRFEHAILQELGKQQLSFKVPTAVLSVKDGQPHKLLSSGAEACIFEIIPGTLAKTTSPAEVGRATGELCTAMGKVQLDLKALPPAIAPYFRLFEVHHAIGTRDRFYQEVATNPEFNVCKAEIDFLVSEIQAIEPKLEEFQKLPDMPLQLIHGDLHYDNVMVEEDTVSGLLDFEFCAYDWRAMELAVALSKYVGEAEPLPLISEFCDGYFKHGELTEQEINCMPDLINLRIFSNVVYFTGRAIAKEDTLESLTSRAAAYAKRVRWINANRDAIKHTLRQKQAAYKKQATLVAA